jgi:hypothetical protein
VPERVGSKVLLIPIKSLVLRQVSKETVGEQQEPPRIHACHLHTSVGVLKRKARTSEGGRLMEQGPLQHADTWAAQNFGAAELGDPRRTDRLIKIANALAENPSASLPHALETWGETQGAYRFLNDPAFNYQEILMPHWSQVYHEASQCSRTLLLADTTEFDFTTHHALKGRGPVGNSKENIGFSLHTVLAMHPQTQEILGCMTLSPFLRKLAPVGETRVTAQEARERIAGLGAQHPTDRTGP